MSTKSHIRAKADRLSYLEGAVAEKRGAMAMATASVEKGGPVRGLTQREFRDYDDHGKNLEGEEMREEVGKVGERWEVK